jgi:hypothetical protein
MAASAAAAPAMDAMVTKVRIVMVSPPWLSPRPLRTDAAWRGHVAMEDIRNPLRRL